MQEDFKLWILGFTCLVSSINHYTLNANLFTHSSGFIVILFQVIRYICQI